MILEYGPTAKLRNAQWHILELTNESTAEQTLHRLALSIPQIFRNYAIELFVPVSERDLNRFHLESGSYLFVRSTSFPALLKLKRVLGVVSLLTEKDCGYASRVIQVSDEYVQGIIQRLQQQHEQRPANIKPGSFVRVIAGETNGFCGHVQTIADDRATVHISLNTKTIILDTPLRNLLDLSHVPEPQQVFHYSSLLADAAEPQDDDNDEPCPRLRLTLKQSLPNAHSY